MIKRLGVYFGGFGVIVIALLFLAWATSPDPKGNVASFETPPLIAGIAPLDEATTLAQFRDDKGAIVTMQIVGLADEMVTGIILTALGASANDDPFAALASTTAAPLTAQTATGYPTITVAMARLLPSGPSGEQHIGTGTNFPEHAEEAGSPAVFNFPKFGPATAARTTVRARVGILLDYEVELCTRFDRDIASLADFDAAVKGVFLCGDFTNRNALVELADPDNLDSGSGFSDAKSGSDYFPTGPFLVIPKDWPGFIAKLRMTTSVNGDPRQDARGAEMTLDFRQLTERSLADMAKPRFLYADKYYHLAPKNRIAQNMTLMSGTSEGVIFAPPTRGDMIAGVVDHAANGGPFAEDSVIDTVKKTFIQDELASGHFLQPGDVVRHDSSALGDIEVKVVE